MEKEKKILKDIYGRSVRVNKKYYDLMKLNKNLPKAENEYGEMSEERIKYRLDEINIMDMYTVYSRNIDTKKEGVKGAIYALGIMIIAIIFLVIFNDKFENLTFLWFILVGLAFAGPILVFLGFTSPNDMRFNKCYFHEINKKISLYDDYMIYSFNNLQCEEENNIPMGNYYEYIIPYECIRNIVYERAKKIYNFTLTGVDIKVYDNYIESNADTHKYQLFSDKSVELSLFDSFNNSELFDKIVQKIKEKSVYSEIEIKVIEKKETVLN